ncbi:MAG: putative ABC transporter permease [Oscillospiraceae bacterium]|nr:putative ABC transporter permease [Oscillospiraceae bacterium]
MPYPLVEMVLYFFTYSFCGWLLETVLCSIQERRFINRGFLGGPICPIYGSAVLLIFIILMPVRDGFNDILKATIIILPIATILATVVEYIISWLMERIFHERWWDYSHMRFNINGRVNLGVSLGWGVLATFFLYFVQPLFEQLVALLFKVNDILPYSVAGILFVMFVTDIIVSSVVALKLWHKFEHLYYLSEMIKGVKESLKLPTKEKILGRIDLLYEKLTDRVDITNHIKIKGKNPAPEWRAMPFDALKRRISEYANELKEKRDALMISTRYLQRRMLSAFPHMRKRGRNTLLRDWREQLQNRKK